MSDERKNTLGRHNTGYYNTGYHPANLPKGEQMAERGYDKPLERSSVHGSRRRKNDVAQMGLVAFGFFALIAATIVGMM